MQSQLNEARVIINQRDEEIKKLKNFYYVNNSYLNENKINLKFISMDYSINTSISCKTNDNFQ